MGATRSVIPDFIAPIQIEQMYVIDSSFHIEPRPGEDMEQRIGLDFKITNLSIDNGHGKITIELSASSELISKDEAAESKMGVSVTVFASASSDLPDELGDEQAKDYLLTNILSMAYAHAKSYIMTLTALSPMGQMILPAILPIEIVRKKNKTATKQFCD